MSSTAPTIKEIKLNSICSKRFDVHVDKTHSLACAVFFQSSYFRRNSLIFFGNNLLIGPNDMPNDKPNDQGEPNVNLLAL